MNININKEKKILEEISDNTLTSIEKLKELLSNRWWRLNNLYKIKDKHGNVITFKMNECQEYIYNNLHTRNVILKIRQEGITTLMEILKLDLCLFTQNVIAGTIADTRENATDIFENKVKFAYDNLPKSLKEFLEMDLGDVDMSSGRERDSARVMRFRNGSAILVGTSLRGQTLQFLHVSEFGKISAKYPDKAKEIRDGAFQTVHEKGIITVESTAEGKNNLFHHLWITCKTMGYGWHDVAMKRFYRRIKHPFYTHWLGFFVSWVGNKRLSLPVEDGKMFYEYIDKPIEKEIYDYFSAIEGKYKVNITEGQKLWWYMKREELKDAVYKEYPATDDEAFSQSVENAIYRKEILTLEKEERFGNFYKEIRDKLTTTHKNKVFAVFDLGIDDYTAIIWFIKDEGKIWIFDCFEGNNEGFDFYLDLLVYKMKEWGFSRYNGLFAPHDINVRDFSTGKTRFDYAREKGFLFQIVQRHTIEDGINAVRNILKHTVVVNANCEILLDRLKQYVRDDKTGKPKHDESSHMADAMRYLALAVEREYQYGVDDVLKKSNNRIDSLKKNNNLLPKGWNI